MIPIEIEYEEEGYESDLKKELPTKGELRPCPFCGSQGDDIYVDEFWERYEEPYFVTCNKCGANGPYTDKKERAIELWNRRVKDDQ